MVLTISVRVGDSTLASSVLVGGAVPSATLDETRTPASRSDWSSVAAAVIAGSAAKLPAPALL